MPMKHMLAALALVSHGALAQPHAIEALDWMNGSWSQESARETVRETWLGPANGLMAGVNLTSTASGRATFEFFRIARTAEGFSYFASPGGRPAVEFPVKEVGERRVVFENAAHDYPRRILYWREGAILVARIEGTLRGQARAEEWRFARVVTRE
jgi:hypothetical protein